MTRSGDPGPSGRAGYATASPTRHAADPGVGSSTRGETAAERLARTADVESSPLAPADGRVVRRWRGDQRVSRVEDDQAVAFGDGDTFEDHRPAVFDADDLAPPGEHGGDRAGAVGHDDLEGRDAVARGDHDAMDLPADADRPARHDLGEVGDPQPLAAIHQAGALEIVDRGPQPLAQRLHTHVFNATGAFVTTMVGRPSR